MSGFQRPILDMALLDDILETYGDTLIKVTLAIWGEPLLHRRFPEIVKRIAQYDILTECSSNLALPLNQQQLEAIVRSGLGAMRLSVDGTSEETCQLYRRGAVLQQVLDNMRGLVAAKCRLGMTTPCLQWQFLEFPWNQHELEIARQMAGDIGVDSFNHFPGDLWKVQPTTRPRNAADDMFSLDSAMKARLAGHNLKKGLMMIHNGCDFLDHGLAINSDGVIQPCCYVVEPKNSIGRWQTGNKHEDWFNLPLLQRLRNFVSHGSEYEHGAGAVCSMWHISICRSHKRPDHLFRGFQSCCKIYH